MLTAQFSFARSNFKIFKNLVCIILTKYTMGIIDIGPQHYDGATTKYVKKENELSHFDHFMCY